MSKNIILTDLVISTMIINYDKQFAHVEYFLVDDNGFRWVKGDAIFWVTIPNPGLDPNGDPLPIPENWFQLPAGYISTLIDLRNDADAALTSKFLV